MIINIAMVHVMNDCILNRRTCRPTCEENVYIYICNFKIRI